MSYTTAGIYCTFRYRSICTAGTFCTFRDGQFVPAKKPFFSVPLKKNKKVEFRFGHNEHILQVSAKSVGKSGARH